MLGLLRICEDEGIDLFYRPLIPEYGIFGMYFRDGEGRPVIVLDKGLPSRPRMERCIMAEEVGHHMTTPTSSFLIAHFSYSLTVAISRDEARALRWAANYLIPTDGLAAAAGQGITGVDELADHFYVTPWMVYRKLGVLKTDLREAWKLRVKNRRDLFSPLLVATQWGQAFKVSNEGGPTTA